MRHAAAQANPAASLALGLNLGVKFAFILNLVRAVSSLRPKLVPIQPRELFLILEIGDAH